jgi:hypothetical protein
MDGLDLTVVMITSPFASMPSLAILQTVFDSFSLIDRLDTVPVKIVMDGYKLSSETRSKKGKITSDGVVRYEAYYEALRRQYQPPQFEIIRCTEHMGFAHAVRVGLEHCTTTFALVAQHDRFFRQSFARLSDLLQAMHIHEHIRYIGFPSTSNITHDKLLHCNYDLERLNRPDLKYDLGEHLYLQPLVFWFDSQHLCHIERYLQIYKPFKSMDKSLFPIVGLRAIKDMTLRRGDFIEDRFGQVQRNLLTSMNSLGCSEETIVQLFKWYGSYLCWMSTNEHPYDVQFDNYRTLTLPMVSHLHGRLFDLQRMEELTSRFGEEKIQSSRFMLIMQQCLRKVDGEENETHVDIENNEIDSESVPEHIPGLYSELLIDEHTV